MVLNWGDCAELGNGGQESEYILGKRSLCETGGFSFKDGPEVKFGVCCAPVVLPMGLCVWAAKMRHPSYAGLPSPGFGAEIEPRGAVKPWETG